MYSKPMKGYEGSLWVFLLFNSITQEEVVCITENDACGVDAVQVITGCTMGKGNLIYRGTGKMVFSFFNRKT